MRNDSGKNISEPNFVLFTWTRTGASNLWNILNQHDEIDCCAEPFHPENGISLRPGDIRGLKRALKTLWRNFNGIKHNHGLSWEQNEYLLTKAGARVVILWRKNALKRVMSLHISRQTNIWGFYNKDNDQRRQLVQDFTFKPFDLKVLKRDMEDYLKEVDMVREMLNRNGVKFYEITYEQLYNLQSDFNAKLSDINDMLMFLGRSPFKNTSVISDIKWKLNPENLKLNTFASYERVPNIHEIEGALGSAERGLLFNDPIV